MTGGPQAMVKPQMKRELAVDKVSSTGRFIAFYGTSDAVTDLGQFGTVFSDVYANHYTLKVDRRFDFDEVVAYVQQSYGQRPVNDGESGE